MDPFVNGAKLDLIDDPVKAVNDTIVVTQDGPSSALNLLGNEDRALLVCFGFNDGSTAGIVQLTSQLTDVANQQAALVFDPGSAFNYLAVGDTATQTVAYRVTDFEWETREQLP